MRNIFLILLLLILTQSCESDKIIDNTPILTSIDSLKFTTTVYKVALNENGKIIDTVSIKKIKTDKQGKTLYSIENKKSDFGDYNVEEYYRKNEDLVFQKIEYSDSWMTEYETFVNPENEVINARMISFEDGEIDTISMSFKHNYSLFGKLQSLSIKARLDTIQSLNFTKYNSDEMEDYEFLIVDNDTIEKINYTYQDGKIKNSKHEYRSRKIVMTSQYGKNEKVKTKINYSVNKDSLIKTSVTNYDYNSKDELVTEETTDLETDSIIRYEYLTAHNNGYHK